MRKIIFILLLFVNSVCQANTYYVSTTGSNSNPGTLAEPFLTITYAESQLSDGVSGDTIFIRVGTYNERIAFYLSDGVFGDPHVIMPYDNEEVIIDGTGIEFSAGSGLILLYSNYITIKGLIVRNSNMEGITTNGGTGIWANRDGCVISGCTVYDCWAGGIRCTNGDNCIVENNIIHDVAQSNSDMIRQDGERWSAGLNMRECTNVTVNDNVIYEVYGEGLSITKVATGTVEDNIVYDIYSPHIYVMNSTNILVQRNFIYTTKEMGDGSRTGIGYWNEGTEPFINSDNTFINNIVYGCKRNLSSMCILTNTIFANNTFINAREYTGVPYNVQVRYYDGETGSEFRNNVIIQEGTLNCIYYNGTQSGITFSNNLYNKSYDSDAVGANDQVSAAHISKVGTYADTSYYRLVSESPAIGGGYDLSGTFTDDYEGTARGVTFDIGALEYAAPDPPRDPILADVETYRPVWATATTATTGGNVIDDGGDPGGILQKGVCWNTTGDPTTADDKTEEGAGTGAFSSTMTGLTVGTVYYVKAYAINSVGTAYGDEMSFRALIIMHDGKIIMHNGKIITID